MEVVVNRNGCFVNLFVNGTPARSMQLDETLSIAQALIYVGTQLHLEQA